MCRVDSLECVGLGTDEAPISYYVRAPPPHHQPRRRGPRGRDPDANAQSRMADRAE
jgi:hypothetical protein